MTLISRTKDIAKLRGLSLDDVALKAGLSAKSIYNWGRNSPKSENLDKVADVLHVSTDYLLGRTDDIHPSSQKSNNELSDFDEEIMMAFDGKPIPDEDKEKLLEFARFLRSQRGK
ncbi:helix-turn-helix domain-containing protein [Leuconostoc citreum]|uniref:helix-turn-helix domain-containing protein n=1 Tax=Leuconostoc citreum TaxID=33964 RepID=UPI0032DE4202